MSATVISVSIPQKLLKQLNTVCTVEERSKSFFIKKALEKFLMERMEDLADYNEAVKVYSDFKSSGENPVAWKDMKKKYNLK